MLSLCACIVNCVRSADLNVQTWNSDRNIFPLHRSVGECFALCDDTRSKPVGDQFPFPDITISCWLVACEEEYLQYSSTYVPSGVRHLSLRMENSLCKCQDEDQLLLDKLTLLRCGLGDKRYTEYNT